jgi:hypothetical protein
MSEREVKHGGCYAFGCPMWGGIKTAGSDDWLCDCHAMSAARDWQEITQKLRENIRLVRACHWAMNLNGPDQARRAGEYMERIGRPDLAPRVRTIDHSYRDRLDASQIIERKVTKDEREHLGLWVQRLRDTLFHEATQKSERREARLEAKKVVETWANASGLLGNMGSKE